MFLWWSFHLFPGDCYWSKVSKSEDTWWRNKELCSTYHAKIYSWAEQCLILGLLGRPIWILVNVYSWFKSLLLVKGQQLRHLVAHLFMNHWALSSPNTLASVLWELQPLVSGFVENLLCKYWSILWKAVWYFWLAEIISYFESGWI